MMIETILTIYYNIKENKLLFSCGHGALPITFLLLYAEII